MKRILIGALAFLLTSSVGLWAADNFVKGYAFDGATGLKTGANLEDLVTQARFTPNAFGEADTNALFAGGLVGDIYDRAIIGTGRVTSAHILDETIASDDILDGSVNTNDLHSDVQTLINNQSSYFTDLTRINLSTSPTEKNWDVVGGTWTNAFDNDEETMTTQYRHNDGSPHSWFYFDLGATYTGWIRCVVSVEKVGIAGGSYAQQGWLRFCAGSLTNHVTDDQADDGLRSWLPGYQMSVGDGDGFGGSNRLMATGTFDGRYIGINAEAVDSDDIKLQVRTLEVYVQ